MIFLPVIPSVPHFDFSTVVAGTSCTFEFRWNDRDGAWYFDAFEAGGPTIALGEKVVLGCALARTRRHPLIASGAFIAYDSEGSAVGKGRDATLDDLGTRVLIAYVTNAELAALILAQPVP